MYNNLNLGEAVLQLMLFWTYLKKKQNKMLNYFIEFYFNTNKDYITLKKNIALKLKKKCVGKY